jgi:hypothetical protein
MSRKLVITKEEMERRVAKAKATREANILKNSVERSRVNMGSPEPTIDEEKISLPTKPVKESIKVETPVPVKKHTTPWKPARILDLPASLRKPGMRPRWVNKDKLGNIQKKIAEGWEMVKVPAAKKQELEMTLQDSLGVDGTIQMRELILMWMPEEIAEERNKYYAQQGHVDSTRLRESMKKSVSSHGGHPAAIVYTREGENKTTFGQIET